MAITTHFGWFNREIDLARLAESQLEQFLNQYQQRKLDHDLYYEGRLLLRKTKYLTPSLGRQVEKYYMNRKEAEMPKPYQIYKRAA